VADDLVDLDCDLEWSACGAGLGGCVGMFEFCVVRYSTTTPSQVDDVVSQHHVDAAHLYDVVL
jgi:hypothetical protein